MKHKLYMDQKKHDFIDSAVLFSRSAVTVKQKSLLATEGPKSMMEKSLQAWLPPDIFPISIYILG